MSINENIVKLRNLEIDESLAYSDIISRKINNSKKTRKSYQKLRKIKKNVCRKKCQKVIYF